MTEIIVELKLILRGPSDGIVEQLKELLVRAEAGEIIAFAHAAVTERLTVLSGWSHDDDDGSAGHGWMLMAAANRLIYNMQKDCDLTNDH